MFDRLTTSIARFFLRLFLRNAPKRRHDSVEIMVADSVDAAAAARFLESTTAALKRIAEESPGTYAALRRDVDQIVLWSAKAGSAYSRFQRAVIVPASVASPLEPIDYQAWLVAASALGHGRRAAQERVDSYLARVPHDTQRIRSLLIRTLWSIDEVSRERPMRG